MVFVIAGMEGVACAQTLTDIGATSPTPGPNDISQLVTNGNQRLTGSFNYYTDNSSPPGQTFTAKPGPLALTSVSIRTGTLPLNSGNGGLGPQAYELRIFAVNGNKAALINSCTSSPAFSYVDGDWLQWTNLTVPLVTNAVYAYSFRRTTGGYDGMAVTASNYYSGGEAVLIPNAGGVVTFQSGHNFDAAFAMGLTNTGQLLAGTPIILPASTVYIGSTIALRSPALGTAPLYYQWQTDGGGGTITNIPGATNSSLVLTPPYTGTFNFSVITTNLSGSVTSPVVSATVLPPAAVSVNVSSTLATMPMEGLGVCTATYDGYLINPTVPTRLKAAGIGAVRYPGGSYADIFNWQTTTGNGGAYVNSNDSFDNWMNTVVNPSGAQAIITVNYGSNPANNAGGDTNVAAAWVDYANNTKHWGIKYWEIGNEIGGNGYYGDPGWEYDLHYPFYDGTRANQPALSPTAYGSNAVMFIKAMKVKDSSIKCGVGFDTGRTSYNTAVLGQCGSLVDFVIIHWYPGGDATALLTTPTAISSIISSTRTQITNNVGAARAGQIGIAITETGGGNVNGAPCSLFAADDYLTWIENGIFNVDYQELHNGFLQNNSSMQPAQAYYGAQMAHLLANVGDTFLKTTSAQSLLRVHATTRLDGNRGVMLINTDPVIPIAATVSFNGQPLATNGIWYQFGLTNFVGASGNPSFPASSNSVTGLGSSFTVSIPPYTMVDLIIPIINTPPVLAAISNQTVNVGQTVAFTAGATDTDQPPQTLTFNLLTGPGNATLNTNSGAFSWRPQVTDANTTNAFSLGVADNGFPNLSATQSFTVTVNPLTPPAVSIVAWNNSQFGLQIGGQSGPDYAVQVSTDLVAWSTLFITNSPPMPFSWTDTNVAAMLAQFYRIKTGPPLP